MSETKTLRDLVSEYGANGVIRIDAGNGSAGPMWIEWDDDAAERIGDIEMVPIAEADMVEDGETIDSITNDARMVMDDQAYRPEYVSEWTEDDDRNAPYQASNPYRYRLIF